MKWGSVVGARQVARVRPGLSVEKILQFEYCGASQMIAWGEGGGRGENPGQR